MRMPCRMIRLAALASAGAIVNACGAARPAAPAPGLIPAVPAVIRVHHEGRVQTVPLDLYAAVVALTELAPGAEKPATVEALYEAQIIVARTYAASRRSRHGADGFDVCDTTHCQRYEAARLETARWATLARTIAGRTAGAVLVHDGRLVEAFFHADCGGHTADAADVWRTGRPYLVATRDTSHPDRPWAGTLAREAVEGALRKDRRTRLAGALRDIEIVRRDRSGRAARIRLTAGPRGAAGTAVEVEGDVFRAVVTAALGFRTLPSTRFSLERQPGGWRATGTGFGHGVGLCQAGALSRARKGDAAAEILGFYYPGAIIERGARR
ncbi:MAG: SpoIID/LytB domain-containing protein [Acidobacteriota bacterium]|nr:SpoIID/LytB domain-containing protein [Acidobacteriota bacterium]